MPILAHPENPSTQFFIKILQTHFQSLQMVTLHLAYSVFAYFRVRLFRIRLLRIRLFCVGLFCIRLFRVCLFRIRLPRVLPIPCSPTPWRFCVRLFRICLIRIRLFRVRLIRIRLFRVCLIRIRLFLFAYSVFAYSVFAYSVFTYSVFAYSVFAYSVFTYSLFAYYYNIFSSANQFIVDIVYILSKFRFALHICKFVICLLTHTWEQSFFLKKSGFILNMDFEFGKFLPKLYE